MIIEAARNVIGEKGMHRTSVRDIAREAGVAVGTVTYHFSGMSEVLAQVLETEMTMFSRGVMEAADSAPTGLQGLRVLTAGLLASGDRAVQHWRLWLDFWALASREARYSEWQAEVYRNLHGLVEDLSRRGLIDGSLSLGDPAEESVKYIAMMDGLVIQGYLPDSALSPEAAQALLQKYVSEMARPD